MRWLKVVGLIGVGVLALIGIFIGVMFYATSGMTDAANGFFAAVKQKDVAKARTFLSEEFRTSTDDAALTAYLAKSSLGNFKESSWESRQVSANGRGELSGSVKTESGGVVPLKLTFVKEAGSWKIYAMEKPSAGLQSDDSRPMPSKSDAGVLVKRSIADFVASVEKKDMALFRGTISRLWQKQITAEKLNEVFRPFIDAKGIDWSILNGQQPVFSAEPKVDEKGVLILIGYYPTKPSQVYFQQKYVYEGVDWRLVGFNIEAK